MAWIAPASGRDPALCVGICDLERLAYDPRELYERASKRRAPEIAPHGRLRALRAQDQVRALEFIRDFGPLGVTAPFILDVEPWEISRSPSFTQGGVNASPCDLSWVNLDAFWAHHARFVAVAALWEAWQDPLHGNLGGALRQFAQLDSAQVEFFDHFPFLDTPEPDDSIPDLVREGEGYTAESAPKLLDWLDEADVNRQAWLAERIIEETITRANADRRFRCVPERRGGRASFGLRPEVVSLWSILWEFFCLDTSKGIGWRTCLDCGGLFYPPRRDRFYCTSQKQVRFSKRTWWKENRAGGAKKGDSNGETGIG